jgi:hypothetical protein
MKEEMKSNQEVMKATVSVTLQEMKARPEKQEQFKKKRSSGASEIP